MTLKEAGADPPFLLRHGLPARTFPSLCPAMIKSWQDEYGGGSEECSGQLLIGWLFN
jgi:hypothetical protein